MAKSLPPIPAGVAITDGQGIITIFFRQTWQLLVDSFSVTPTVATLDLTTQGAAVVTTNLLAVLNGGQYRVNYALVRTVDDGVASSATITIGWTQNGIARTEIETALTEAALLSFQGLSRPMYVDANTAITIAVAYASTTAGKMKFDLHATLEYLGG